MPHIYKFRALCKLYKSVVIGLLLLVTSMSEVSFAEQFYRNIIPFSNAPRGGNNFTAITETGERFQGRSWATANGDGYFCMQSSYTTCGGRYDALTLLQNVEATMNCLDGRQAVVIATRMTSIIAAEAFFFDGIFLNSEVQLHGTFGPTKQFNRGVGCGYVE